METSLTSLTPLLALLSAALPSAPTLAQGATAPARAEADQTPAIVAAAEAFLATLDEAGREAVLFAWEDDAQRARWSNLPEGIFGRAGLRWGDLSEAQREALTVLLGTVLSEDGLRMVREQTLADEVRRIEGGGNNDAIFGLDEYFVSFVGEPAAASPWMLQFGGHHLGINATVVGPDVTLAPSLTGGQPVRFAWEGQASDIVVDEVAAAEALLGSLDEAQREAAVRSETRSDLVLGPGEDGRTLQPEGLLASDMTEEQRGLLLALIEARLGMLNADDLAATMAPIEANLDVTSFTWLGPVDDATSAYWRIVGPSVVIEFAPQDQFGDPAQHLHSMYRDPTNEYGAAWAPRG